MRNLWSRREGKYYDAWESADPATRRQVITERLDAYVRFARETTPFYRERLKSYEAGARHPLAAVPLLTTDDLRKHIPPFGRDLLSSDTRDYTVFQSGGTTGVPKTSVFSHEELDAIDGPNARGFVAVGLTPADRVANLFAVGGLYASFVHINRMLQQYGCTNFPFTNHSEVEFIRTVVDLFKINVFTGITSVVLNALRGIAAGGGTKGFQIERVLYGGEHIYEADKEEIRAAFGTKIIAAPGYGTVDSWYIGYQCEACPTAVFHAHDDQCYIEIVDEETGRHCEPHEVGMVYVTTPPRKVTPIVRYRVGDRAKWLDAPCPCGRTTPLFHLLGRGDDVLRVGYDSVDYAFIQEAVARVPGLRGVAQMEKRREDGKDRLILRVESTQPEARHADLARDLEQQVLSARPSLRAFVEHGTVLPLVVEIHAPDSLPRNARTGKLIRVIDVL